MADQRSKFYIAWMNMKQRCNNSKRSDYERYGGRGIQVCERWEKFSNFKEDMFLTYQEGLSLDRLNNEGNYEISNCRWATNKEQANNRRSNKWITYRGLTKTLSQWANYFNIRLGTLNQRYFVYKWNIEKCFSYRKKGVI